MSITLCIKRNMTICAPRPDAVRIHSKSYEWCDVFAFCCGLLCLGNGRLFQNLQSYFTGTEELIRLPKCQWNNPTEYTLHWRHNERDDVSNHRRLDGLSNYLFRRRLKNTSKLRGTGLCDGNSPVTGEFPSQKASNAEMFPFDDVIMG